MYNTEEVDPAPTSWDVTFEADSPYAGRVTGYDAPIFIADAAMYLMAHEPDLGITDPYELTQEQFDAAVDWPAASDLIGSYWAVYTEEIDGFFDGSMVVGTARPVNLTFTKGPEAANAEAVIPSEGATGWADTWMISANAPNPNCMLKWMDWTMRPEIQAEVGIYYGAAGSNVNSCAEIASQLGEGGEELVNTLSTASAGTWSSWTRCTCGRHRPRTAVTTAGIPASTSPNGRRPGRRSGAARIAVASVTEAADGGAVRRLSTRLYRHPIGRLSLTLGPPLAWMVVIYLGSLAILLVSSFWRLDVFTGEVVRDPSLVNFQTLLDNDVYRTITLRTVGIALAVTLTDIVLAFPLAYYAARLATPRMRNALLIAVVLPLWANYLVRVFAWKLILTPNGF